MREGQPSLTAIWVAFARAVAAYEHELSAVCPDLTAQALLPSAVTLLIQDADGTPRPQSALQLLRFASLGLIDHLAFRTYLIDQALDAALAEGIDQIVLLGAGLDARAYRVHAARDAVVFEVDHPSTQGYKRARAQLLVPATREVRYAACDFEKVTLEQALTTVAFDVSKPSVWIWEGVTMYLRRSAVTASLDAIARATAPGSVVITTYVTPKLANVGPVVARFGMGLLSAISEPVRCTFTSQKIEDELSQRGLVVQSDRLPLDAAQERGIYPNSRASPALIVPDERIVVAKRIDA